MGFFFSVRPVPWRPFELAFRSELFDDRPALIEECATCHYRVSARLHLRCRVMSTAEHWQKLKRKTTPPPKKKRPEKKKKKSSSEERGTFFFFFSETNKKEIGQKDRAKPLKRRFHFCRSFYLAVKSGETTLKKQQLK